MTLSLIMSGCGGGNLAPDCDGFTGQYGAPGSPSELVENRIVRVFVLTNCDSTEANCVELPVKTTKTGSDGKFTISGLTNGNYRVRTYSVDGTQLLQTNTINLPDVCYATPTPSPSPTPTAG